MDVVESSSFLRRLTQRLALAASGRDERVLGSRILLRRGNCLKIAQTPTCRLHAVLDGGLV